MIDEEVRSIVDVQARRAADLLRASRPALDAVAKALCEQETLDAAQLDAIIRSAGGQQGEHAAHPPSGDGVPAGALADFI